MSVALEKPPVANPCFAEVIVGFRGPQRALARLKLERPAPNSRKSADLPNSKTGKQKRAQSFARTDNFLAS